MAISYDEYVKKKKKNQDTTANITNLGTSSNKTTSSSSQTNDDVDTQALINKYLAEKNKKTTTKTTTKKEEKPWYKEIVDAGAFGDGYDFGDVTKTILGTTADVGIGVVKGVSDIGHSASKLIVGGIAQVSDWVGQDGYADKLRNRLAGKDEEVNKRLEYTPSGLLGKADEALDNASLLGETADEITQGVGYYGGMLALQSVGVPWQVTTGVSSAGNELGNAYANNANDFEAWLSSGISAGVNIGSEYLFGGLKLPGTGKASDKLLGQLTDKISKKGIKYLVQGGVQVTGEGFEEVLAGLGTAIGQKLTYMDDSELSELYSSEDALKDFVIGAAVSGITMGANPNTHQNISEGKSLITGLTSEQAKAIETETNNRIKEQENKGITLTTQEKNVIEEQVIKEITGQQTDQVDDIHFKDDEPLGIVEEEKEETIVPENNVVQEEANTQETLIQNNEIAELINQIEVLENTLNTNQNAIQQQEILNQIRMLENQINSIQQGGSQVVAPVKVASVENTQINDIAPVKVANVEETSNTTTQESNSNLATEAESNIQEVPKSQTNEVKTPTKAKEGVETQTDEIAPVKERKTVNTETAETLQEQSSKVMTEEEYLASKGYGFMGYSEAGLHKGSKNESTRGRKQAVDLVQKRAQEYDVKRQELRKEYQAKLESGEIRKPTSIEQSLKTAQGNEDNPSVQAARRVLTKRGIDWKTGEQINKENKTPTQEELDNLENTRKNKSGSEYASAFYALEKKYGSANLYKGLNSYKSTGKALSEDIAPIKEELSDLTDVLKDTTKDIKKEVKALTKELNEVKSSIDDVKAEFKALTETDLPFIEQQASDNLRTATDDMAPVIEDTTPEDEMTPTKDLFDIRDYAEVGNRKINAYQYDNPEVRPFFQTAARSMLSDLSMSTKGERYIDAQVLYDTQGEAGAWGHKRNTTPDIAELLDGVNGKFKMSYAEIENGLNNIIEDKGSENNAVSKRIEFYLDQRLRYGYTTVEGYNVPPNQDYINLISSLDTTDYYNSLELPSEDLAPIQEQFTAEDIIESTKRMQSDFNTEVANENHPPLSDEFINELTEQNIEWARRSGKLVEPTTNKSLAIEQEPTNNGGRMIRVSPTMQKRTLNTNSDNKPVDWNSLEDTSKGVQESFMPKRLGDTLTDTSLLKEKVLADEQAKKFGVEAEEQNNAETIEQILTERPKKVKGKWDNANRIKKLGAIKLLQKDYYINKLARETNNQSLSEDSNNLRHANRISSQITIDGIREWKVDRTKRRHKGRLTSTQKAKGLDQIYTPVENAGLTQEFDDYAYNLHNIDRMSIESRANKKMTDLKDTTLKGYTIGQIEKMAKGIEPNDEQLNLDLKLNENEVKNVIEASQEYVRLSKEKNKTVFGEQITADVSKQNLKKYEQYESNFDERVKELNELNDALLDFDIESGRLTQEEKEFIKERYPNYVPVYYAIEDVAPSGKKYDKREVRIKEALDVAEGGSSDIIPLKDAMQIKIRQKVNQNLMNKMGLNIMHTLDKQGKLNVISTESQDAYERFNKSNEELVHKMTDGGYSLTVYENGDKITFEIPLEIYEALKPSDIMVIDTLNTLVDMKRALMTEYNLYFAIRNIIRDMPTAFLQSQNSAQWLMNVPEAVYQVASKGQYYQLAQTLGAGNNDYANMNQRNFADIAPTKASDIQAEQDYQGNKFKRGWEAFKNWRGVKWIADINAFMEQVPRMAEFITTLDNSVQENINPLTGAKYTYAQDEVTVNFGKGGDWTKTADRNITNFMNASLQGGMKLIDTFRDAYAYKGAKGLANNIIKYSLAGASMIALMNWAWSDDEDYEELSDYIKNNYYVLGKLEDGKFLKIPKGRTNAVIESVMNNGFKLMSGEMSLEDALKDTYSVIDNNIAPATFGEANLFATIKQIYTNTSWYGEDLVPSRLQSLPAEEQYDETTDKFSIWLGQELGLSPYKINYFINQTSGFIGDMVLPLLTDQAETPIDNDAAEMFLGQFYKDYTTDSVMKNQNVTDFFELSDELKVASSSSKATDEDKIKYKYISSINGKMNELYAEKREIQSNKDLTDSEKVEALREVQQQINNFAKEGLEQYNNGIYTENYASIGGVKYQQKENEDGELYWSKVDDDESEELDSLGFTDSQLNEYFYIRRDFTKLNNKYHDDKDALKEEYGANSEEYEEALDVLSQEKKNTIIDTILNTDFSSEQKAYLYDSVYESKAIDTVVLTGINFDYLLDYEKHEFKANYNTKGNAIPNSRKNKVIDYINTYDLSIAEKAILIKSTNTFKFNDYNDDIVNYVSNLGLGYEDKVYVLEELGMTVYDDGTVEW